MRAENGPRPSRLLRVREFVDHPLQKPAPDPGKPGKSRFVEPYHFPAEALSAIGALLQQAGMGDRDGRQLFVTALEYEIGLFRSTVFDAPPARPKPPPPTRTERELPQLGQLVSQLLAVLQQTGKAARTLLGERLTTSDPFARVHDCRYFDQLEIELQRIALACVQREEPPAEPPAPAMSDGTRRLILQLARIFRECLEIKLTPEALEIFSQVLCIIRDSVQINIPCESDILARVLSDTQ